MADPKIGRSRIPELLAKIGKQQYHLAEHLGVSEPFLSQVISGKRQLSVVKRKKAADYLGCTSDDLNATSGSILRGTSSGSNSASRSSGVSLYANFH